MKFQESHFEEYIVANNTNNLHPKLDKIFSKFPDNINKFENIIFYGPSGVGKYTQMLRAIKKYSPKGEYVLSLSSIISFIDKITSDLSPLSYLITALLYLFANHSLCPSLYF